MFVQVELHSSIFLLISYGLWPADLPIFYLSIQVSPFTNIATFSMHDICSGIAKMRHRTNRMLSMPNQLVAKKIDIRKVKYSNIAVSRLLIYAVQLHHWVFDTLNIPIVYIFNQRKAREIACIGYKSQTSLLQSKECFNV